ncbi:MAG: tetratricopeptide repeat protein [Bacteroidia bacterium]|nr:tetratricopeptide repeat protein [Bacteroidia bacterium]
MSQLNNMWKPVLVMMLLFWSQKGLSQAGSYLLELQEKLDGADSLLTINFDCDSIHDLLTSVELELDSHVSSFERQDDAWLKTQGRCYYLKGRCFMQTFSMNDASDQFNRALAINKRLNNVRLQAEVLRELEYVNWHIGDSSKLELFISQLKQFIVEVETPAPKAIAQSGLANYYRKAGKRDSALQHFLEAVEILERDSNERFLPAVLNDFAILLQRTGSKDLAIRTYLRSIRILERKGTSSAITTKFNLVVLLMENKDYPDAVKYLDELEASLKPMAKPQHKARLWHQKGLLYYELGQPQLAIEYLNKSLNLISTFDMGSEIAAMVRMNLGRQYKKLGNYERALDEFKTVELAMARFARPIFKARLYNSMGEVHTIMGNYAEGDRLLNLALKWAKQSNSPQTISQSYELLYTLYKKQLNHKQALRFHELFLAYRDSVKNEELTQLLLGYEFEKRIQDRNLELAMKQQEVLLLKSSIRKRNYAVVLALLFCLIVAALVKIYWESKRTSELAMTNTINRQLYEIDLLREQAQVGAPNSGNALDLKIAHLNSLLDLPLTQREIDVLKELITGKSNKEIAEILFLSPNTIGTHLKKIYYKLEVNNRTQASQKLLKPDPLRP